MMHVQADAFSFIAVSQAEVVKKRSELNCSKATGLNNIPTRFLRDGAELIAPCVTQH
jgi:hypothetical protein